MHAVLAIVSRASITSSTCSSIDDDPVRIAQLTLVNTSASLRHLSVFAYNDWVIGPPRELDTRHVITDYDTQHHAVLAWNPYNTDVLRTRRASRRAASAPISATGNRRSFLGRNGSMARPSALGDDSLTGEFGAGMDPCAALQIRVRARSPARPARWCSCSARACRAIARARR